MAGSSKNNEKLEAAINQLLVNQQTFQEEISSRMANLEAQVIARSNIGPESSNNGLSPFSRTAVKLNIPHFDGSNPLGWIFKITQYFELPTYRKINTFESLLFPWKGRPLAGFSGCMQIIN